MSQPTTVNIPSDLNATLRDMAARNANLAQELAMAQGQVQTLLNLLTPDQIASLQAQQTPQVQAVPAEPANRAERRQRERATKRAPAKKTAAKP